ncbi:hypothetical protein EV421DRAFT_1731552 [Armillaria borealis]|uniref:Uncharacterized protein n=1 Tax=Armillaria borealis TaxID=47425 RepID=A0AA39JZL1_9AGAR|nr:hypothetical protein EV421DRAFT_1731552 [Armillaria borealis]
MPSQGSCSERYISRALDRWPRIHGCLEANLTGVGFPNDDQQPGSCWCNSIMGSYIDAPSLYFITTASALDSYLLINTMDDLVLANETTGMNDSHYRYPTELASTLAFDDASAAIEERVEWVFEDATKLVYRGRGQQPGG